MVARWRGNRCWSSRSRTVAGWTPSSSEWWCLAIVVSSPGWSGSPGASRSPAPPLGQRGAGRCCCVACGRRSEEHTSELQSQSNLVCRLLLEKKKKKKRQHNIKKKKKKNKTKKQI